VFVQCQFIVFVINLVVSASYKLVSLMSHDYMHNVTMYMYDQICIILRICVLSIKFFIYIYIMRPSCHVLGGLYVLCRNLIFSCLVCSMSGDLALYGPWAWYSWIDG